MTTELMKVEAKAVVVNNPFCAATLADWIQYCDVQPCTQKTYDKAVKSFAGYLKSNAVESPTRQDVINFRKWMTDEDNDGEIVFDGLQKILRVAVVEGLVSERSGRSETACPAE